MMVYEKALKLIALLEHPQPEHMDEDDYQIAIEECVAAKFRSATSISTGPYTVIGAWWLPRSTELTERATSSRRSGTPRQSRSSSNSNANPSP